MAQGDFTILATNRISNDMKVTASQLANTRELIDLIVSRMANMDFNQINTFFGTDLIDAAERTTLVNQFTSAQTALADNSIDNIINFIG